MAKANCDGRLDVDDPAVFSGDITVNIERLIYLANERCLPCPLLAECREYVADNPDDIWWRIRGGHVRPHHRNTRAVDVMAHVTI